MKTMKKPLYPILKATRAAVGFTRLPRLLALWLGRKKVSILNYHDPEPQLFAKQMAWLHRRYQPISQSELLEAIMTKSDSQLPAYPLLITIDDGWRGNVALCPIIEKYRIPVTIYLSSGIVGTHRKFWWLPVYEAGGNPQMLKPLPHAEFLDTLKKQYDYEPERDYPERCALSWEELEDLKRTDLVTFGSHGRYHFILPQCPEDVAWDEISASKKELEEQLDLPIIHFSFPNGEYSLRDQKLLRTAGYQTGRTTQLGFNNVVEGVDPYAIKTLLAADNNSLPVLSFGMGGLDVLREMIL
jgi:peptidoglycan/xylan/chitin deacetylase (PgdA/CDA1 family)